MSKPILTENQVFNLNVGEQFNDSIGYSGDVNSWSAAGLPDGISIDSSGGISGIATIPKTQNSLIVISNDDGSSAGVIKFIINSTNSYNNDFIISPSYGYAGSTSFEFSSNIFNALSTSNIFWNFGDGTYSFAENPKHIYKNPGKYTISLNALSGVFNVSYAHQVQVNLLINESIYFDFAPPPTFAGHLNRYPFIVKFTSTKEGPHYIDLAVQYSRSYQYQEPRNKWSFLRPEWKFLDENLNQIDYIIPNETKLYADSTGKITDESNGLFVGVSGYATFYVVDDIYNFDLTNQQNPYSTVIATLRTSGIPSYIDNFNTNISVDLPSYSNSLAIATCPHIYLWASPDNINIKENGIRDYINPRWSSAIQPIIVDTNFDNPYLKYWCNDGNNVTFAPTVGNFYHNIPYVNSTDVNLQIGVVGVSSKFIPNTKFTWTDNTGYLTPGYYKGYFEVPNSTSTTNAYLTAKFTYNIPNLSAQYMYNPILWVSNPEAGMMSNFQYTYDSKSVASTIKNLNIAHINNFDMPIITEPDFTNNPMAVSGFHGIYSIAAVPYPDYHAWALDSEMNQLYRVSTAGQILCAVDINQIVSDKLGFFIPNQVSPANLVLDSKKNIWMTLYDTVSTLKFDSYGNFLSAFNPIKSIGYRLPTNIDSRWYEQNTYFSSLTSLSTISDIKYKYIGNNIDINPIEPTGIDTDTKDNVWVTYSNFMSGYLIKYDTVGNLLYTYSYPVCSCPQQIVVDNKDNVWIALSDNIYSTIGAYIEKRSSTGVLLSAWKNVRGVNYLTLDTNQNLWFTASYNILGSINNSNGSVFTTNVGSVSAFDWFNPNVNTDETALEGIGCDLLGRIYVINSIENQVYVYDSVTKTFLNKFIINPQGFTFFLGDQYEPTLMDVNVYNKSLQASGDWTGNRWINKYLTASSYTNLTKTISGQSVVLDIQPSNNKDAFKFNEGFDMANHMHSLAFMPSLNESTFLFDNVLGSIYGSYPFKHNDLGVKAYEKIANFNSNITDVDYCGYKNIYDLAKMVDFQADTYSLSLPPDVEKILDFSTINKSRLFGARSVDQTAFTKPNSKGILNRGDLLTSTYKVTAGIPVLLKDRSLNKYRFIPTGYVNSLSTYALSALAASIGLVDYNWPSYYEFYSFIPSFDGVQTDGIIDWSNPQTTLSENLSSINYWFGIDGVLDKQISYTLYKGLGLLD